MTLYGSYPDEESKGPGNYAQAILVNTVTPALFRAYPTIVDYANARGEEIDRMVTKINFHSNKAKNIRAAAKMIMDDYGGQVPDAMEKLDALPGVTRKTANVILGSVFGKAEGIVIDTHGIQAVE